MANIVTFTTKDFGQGINQLAAETQLPEGFIENALNMDCSPEGSLVKRSGYKLSSSGLPWLGNVVGVTVASGGAATWLPNSLTNAHFIAGTPDLESWNPSVIKYKTPTGSLTSKSYVPRLSLIAPTSGLTIYPASLGITDFSQYIVVVYTWDAFKQIPIASKTDVDTITINTSGNLQVTFVGDTSIPRRIELIPADFRAVFNVGPIGLDASTTPELALGNPVVRCWKGLSSSSTLTQVYQGAGGTDLNLTTVSSTAIQGATGVSAPYVVVCGVVTTDGVLFDGGDAIAPATDSTFILCQEVTPSTNIISVNYSEGPSLWELNRTTSGTSTFHIYTTATLSTKMLGTDIATDNVLFYTGKEDNVSPNGLFNYQAMGTTELLAIKHDLPFKQATASTTYVIERPTRIMGTLVSAFQETGSTAAQAVGAVVFDECLGEGKAHAYSLSATAIDRLDIQFQATNLKKSSGGNLVTFTGDAGIYNGWVVISGAQHSSHNGIYRVVSIYGDSTTNVLRVTVDTASAVQNSVFDEVNSGALCQLNYGTYGTTSASPVYRPETTVVLADGTSLTAPYGSYFYFSGQKLNERAAPIKSIKAKTDYLTFSPASTVPIAVGTELNIGTQTCRVSATYQYGATLSGLPLVTVVDDGVEATITVAGTGSGTTQDLFDTVGIGSKLLTHGASPSSSNVGYGTWEVTQRLTSKSVKCKSNGIVTTGVTTYLAGSVAWLDREIEIDYMVDQVIGAPVWSPIASKTNQFISSTLANSPYLPSNPVDTIWKATGAVDNLYLTSGTESPWKYDGANFLKAGLTYTQLIRSVRKDIAAFTSPIAKSAAFTVGATVGTENFIVSKAADYQIAKLVQVGDSIQVSAGKEFVVVGIDEDALTSVITFRFGVALGGIVLLDGATVRKVVVYRYYARLSYVDANNNIINCSPGESPDDVIVSRTTTDGVSITFSFPFLGLESKDYANWRLEIYRTKADELTPFYLVNRAYVTGNTLTYKESTFDDTLAEVEDGIIAGDLNGFFPSPTARAITTFDKSVVLGNITGTPQVEIVANRLGNTGNSWSISNTGSVNTFIVSVDGTGSIGSTQTNPNSFLRLQLNTGVSAAATTTIEKVSVSSGSAVYKIVNVTYGSCVDGQWFYLILADAGGGLAGLGELAGAWYRMETPTSGTDIFFTGPDTDLVLTTVYSNKVLICVGDPTRKSIPIYVDANTISGAAIVAGRDLSQNSADDTLASPDFRLFRQVARCVNYVVSRYATNPGWVKAFSGNASGKAAAVRFEFVDSDSTVTIPILGVDYHTWYANGVLLATGEQAGTVTQRFPSRVCLSVNGQPELFQRPFIPVGDVAKPITVIDVNPSDGDEIVAITPTTGSSVQGAAMLSSDLAVFKNNSIYMVDVLTGKFIKLETRGVGCTFPNSIQVVRDGVMFAHTSGIYKLGVDRQIHPVGRFLGRYWKNTVDTTQVYGPSHVDPLTNKYRLTVALKDGTSSTLVYDYSREDSEQASRAGGSFGVGSWTIHKYAHTPTAWVSHEEAVLFTSSGGQIYELTEELNDAGQAIPAYAILRAEDFGDSGIRKIVRAVRVAFRNKLDMNNTLVSGSRDHRNEFEPMDPFKIDLPYNNTGLSDEVSRKVDYIKFTPATKKCLSFQVKIENAMLDEPLEVCGVDYRVGGMTEDGTTDAGNTGR